MTEGWFWFERHVLAVVVSVCLHTGAQTVVHRPAAHRWWRLSGRTSTARSIRGWARGVGGMFVAPQFATVTPSRRVYHFFVMSPGCGRRARVSSSTPHRTRQSSQRVCIGQIIGFCCGHRVRAALLPGVSQLDQAQSSHAVQQAFTASAKKDAAAFQMATGEAPSYCLEGFQWPLGVTSLHVSASKRRLGAQGSCLWGQLS